jgi:hypothetical protein
MKWKEFERNRPRRNRRNILAFTRIGTGKPQKVLRYQESQPRFEPRAFQMQINTDTFTLSRLVALRIL